LQALHGEAFAFVKYVLFARQARKAGNCRGRQHDTGTISRGA